MQYLTPIHQTNQANGPTIVNEWLYEVGSHDTEWCAAAEGVALSYAPMITVHEVQWPTWLLTYSYHRFNLAVGPHIGNWWLSVESRLSLDCPAWSELHAQVPHSHQRPIVVSPRWVAYCVTVTHTSPTACGNQRAVFLVLQVRWHPGPCEASPRSILNDVGLHSALSSLVYIPERRSGLGTAIGCGLHVSVQTGEGHKHALRA
jgi:hypothetical protein